MQSRPSGLTLIEITIVLVIIGLLLGGVLRGEEMIFNSKVKATFNLSREISAAINSYVDRYGQLPGDDPQAASRFPNALPRPVNGNGDGRIPWTGGCASGTETSEQCEALYELRLAGFLSGSGLGPVRTPFGGQAEIASGADVFPGLGKAPVMFFYGAGLPTKAASSIDTAFDDGAPRTGAFRCDTRAYDRSSPASPIGVSCVMTL
jgi:prepilin-type N-terminal cleavage/methylation domain-containing protein